MRWIGSDVACVFIFNPSDFGVREATESQARFSIITVGKKLYIAATLDSEISLKLKIQPRPIPMSLSSYRCLS